MIKTIIHVSSWNLKHRGTILAYTLGHGGMYEKPRQKGWVVQTRGEQGEKSRYFTNKPKAMLYLNSEII